jgi:hypothetical protein
MSNFYYVDSFNYKLKAWSNFATQYLLSFTHFGLMNSNFPSTNVSYISLYGCKH